MLKARTKTNESVPAPAGNDLKQKTNLSAEPKNDRLSSRTANLVNLSGEPAIQLDHVSKVYKAGSQSIEVLQNVSLTISKGEFVVLAGPSGSGKSTLLHLIGGLDKPTTGRIMIEGRDIGKLKDSQLSDFRNQTIGFVFQFFYLQPFLSLEANIELPGMFARFDPKERTERAKMLAGTVGIGDRLEHLPRELSGGQMQRAAIARALMNNPKLILADEPTGNLDSTNSRAIIDLLDKIRKQFNTTVVIVTHDTDVANRADRQFVIEDGKVTLK